jgi:FixJ family two-component response regulator
VQGCADGLQEVTDNLAHGLDEVRAVEQALNLSRAALARSEAALAESRTAEQAARRPAVDDQGTGRPDHDRPMRNAACDLGDAEGASAGPLPPAGADPSVGVIKVLVADDDSFMRDLVHRVLAGAGMQVMSYASAAELLGAGNLASTSVLLLDVKMPGMSGLDLQDLLRHRGVDLPVVFMSGASDLELAVTAMRNGAADFIEKPFRGALLIDRVRRAAALHTDRKLTTGRLADPVVMARFETLTAREREVFDLLVTGMSSKLIARELGGSFRTIEIHRAQVMHKMGARHLSELVRMSIESMPSPRVHAR